MRKKHPSQQVYARQERGHVGSLAPESEEVMEAFRTEPASVLELDMGISILLSFWLSAS
jgi:hypothetical protein